MSQIFHRQREHKLPGSIFGATLFMPLLDSFRSESFARGSTGGRRNRARLLDFRSPLSPCTSRRGQDVWSLFGFFASTGWGHSSAVWGISLTAQRRRPEPECAARAVLRANRTFCTP